MAVHVLYLYHTLPWLRAVLYEYSCTVILLPVQRTSTAVQAVFSITQHITCTIPRYIASLLTGSW